MRAFVGIPMPEAAVAALVQVQEALGQGRAVAEENLHLTLVFLDDQPRVALEALHAALEEIALPRPELRFSGVEVRGGRRPALVWAEVEREPTLIRLQEQVRGAARRAGITLPRARFRPHVTLARFGRSKPVDAARLAGALSALGGFRAGPFAAERVCLCASTLTPEGPIYDVLAEYGLS